MPVTVHGTPNPNALKFEVGVDVGGPKAFASGQAADDPLATELLVLPGVVSVFMSADFVTLTKSPEGEWAEIAEPAQEILERHFD